VGESAPNSLPVKRIFSPHSHRGVLWSGKKIPDPSGEWGERPDGQSEGTRAYGTRETNPPLPFGRYRRPLSHRLPDFLTGPKEASKGLGRLRLWGKGQSDPPLVQLLRKISACKFCTHKISMGAKKPHPTLPFAPTRPLTD